MARSQSTYEAQPKNKKLPPLRRTLANVVHFFSRIDMSGECWLWTGPQSHGYGIYHKNGRCRAAHRISYQLWFGRIPPTRELDHLCANKACVNPFHLEIVTAGENCRRGILARRFGADILNDPKARARAKFAALMPKGGSHA